MYIGTASWNIPKNEAGSFPSLGSHLERYSKIFNAVEINSTFYKDHLPKSYSKWAAITPDHFKFSVKLHQRFTHTCEDASTIDLAGCLEGIANLGEKWRVLLLQFPAGKNFSAYNMNKIYKIIRRRFNGILALEPRNIGWGCRESLELMKEYNVSKVIADPEKCPGIDQGEEKYYRLHGSPEIYSSNYDDEYLNNLYIELKCLEHETWCIFDNTTFGHATSNALALVKKGEIYDRRTRLYEERASALHSSH